MPSPSPSFTDPTLGAFTPDSSPVGQGVWRNWSGRLQRGGVQITMGLGGDGKGPRPWLLEELRKVVANLEAIDARAAKGLAECAPAYSLSQFRIESITVWDEVDEIFEIRYVSASGDDEAVPNVETCWPAEQVVHHLIVIGRDYRGVLRDGKMVLPEAKVPADCGG